MLPLALTLGVPPDRVEQLVRHAEINGMRHGFALGLIAAGAFAVLVFVLSRKHS